MVRIQCFFDPAHDFKPVAVFLRHQGRELYPDPVAVLHRSTELLCQKKDLFDRILQESQPPFFVRVVDAEAHREKLGLSPKTALLQAHPAPGKDLHGFPPEGQNPRRGQCHVDPIVEGAIVPPPLSLMPIPYKMVGYLMAVAPEPFCFINGKRYAPARSQIERASLSSTSTTSFFPSKPR